MNKHDIFIILSRIAFYTILQTFIRIVFPIFNSFYKAFKNTAVVKPNSKKC